MAGETDLNEIVDNTRSLVQLVLQEIGTYDQAMLTLTKAERADHARAVRWWSAYTSVLNGRHLAGDPVAVAHQTACAAAVLAAGEMPAEFEVSP